MSGQAVGAKLLRKISAATGQTVERALVWNDGQVFWFRTPEDRHGWWHRPSGDWDWTKDGRHWSSCPNSVTRITPGALP